MKDIILLSLVVWASSFSIHLLIKWITTPRVGSKVSGNLGYGTSFIGIVTEDNSDCFDFPHYKIRGTIYIDTEWLGMFWHDVSDEVVLARQAKKGWSKDMLELVWLRRKQGLYNHVSKRDESTIFSIHGQKLNNNDK